MINNNNYYYNVLLNVLVAFVVPKKLEKKSLFISFIILQFDGKGDKIYVSCDVAQVLNMVILPTSVNLQYFQELSIDLIFSNREFWLYFSDHVWKIESPLTKNNS